MYGIHVQLQTLVVKPRQKTKYVDRDSTVGTYNCREGWRVAEPEPRGAAPFWPNWSRDIATAPAADQAKK